MKRILLIAAAVLVLIGIGVGIYFYFFARTATLTVGQAGSLPSAGTGAIDTSAGTPSTQSLGVAVPGAGTDVAPRLVRITDRPVALGSVAVYVPRQKIGASTASTTATYTDPEVRVEYIERESGNIYAYQAHARTLVRLSNKTLPGVQEASWLSDGSLAYVRFLEKNGTTERIDTYALPATTTAGYFLQQDLSQVLVRATSTLVTLLSTSGGSSASISTPSGTGLHTLFTTALSSIRLAFSGANYVVTTKGSATTDGYSFVVDGKTGAFTRALGPLQGLSTLASPSGKYLLYSYLANGKLALAFLDLSTHVATRLPLSTLPEKCVWMTDDSAVYCGVPTTFSGTLPDDWYQGAVSFSDRIWKIDLAGRVATLVIDPKQAGNVDVDAVGLSLDSANDILLFTNKRDSLLYAYDL
ncbi:MAG: hypothetical protein JWO84_332 [Parcubacteria group bacterium]|nr:hypothetical protein [Parcubacteria group bacterium]